MIGIVFNKTIEDISLVAMQIAKKLKEKNAHTFKIEARREDKNFYLNSSQIAIMVILKRIQAKY